MEIGNERGMSSESKSCYLSKESRSHDFGDYGWNKIDSYHMRSFNSCVNENDVSKWAFCAGI